MDQLKVLRIVCAVQSVLLVAAIVVMAVMAGSASPSPQTLQNTDAATTTTVGTIAATTTIADENAPTAQTTQTTQVSEPTHVTDATTDPAFFELETPYATLRYPMQWADRFRTEAVEENGVFSEVFYATVNGAERELYRVMFGDTDTGTLIGYLEVNEESVPFSVYTTSEMPDDTWSEEDTLTFQAMLASVNDVIESVTSLERFLG